MMRQMVDGTYKSLGKGCGYPRGIEMISRSGMGYILSGRRRPKYGTYDSERKGTRNGRSY